MNQQTTTANLDHCAKQVLICTVITEAIETAQGEPPASLGDSPIVVVIAQQGVNPPPFLCIDVPIHGQTLGQQARLTNKQQRAVLVMTALNLLEDAKTTTIEDLAELWRADARELLSNAISSYLLDNPSHHHGEVCV